MDEETLQFYRGNAEAYAKRTFTSRQARLTAFLALLPPGASILELGCGASGDTAEMLARGFDVRPTDGSPEMAAVASKHLGRTVETLLFHDLDEVEAPMMLFGPMPACCTCRGRSLRMFSRGSGAR